jgi:hypothetical protein
MSIQSEINRIQNNVKAALKAIEDKGIPVPKNATSDDLAQLIALIGRYDYPMDYLYDYEVEE